MAGAHRIGWLATLLLASGCVYASQSVRPEPRLWAGGRPVAGYYCYDCHGYRYFDPYYDWCPNYGFVIHWDRSPELTRVYRERYVALKRRDRRLGRWRYATDYRVTRRYREPRDYQVWLDSRSPGRLPPPDPEQKLLDRGKTERERREADPRPDPTRDHRPRRNGSS